MLFLPCFVWNTDLTCSFEPSSEISGWSQKRSKSNEAQLKLHSFVIIIEAFWLADWVMTSGLHYIFIIWFLLFYDDVMFLVFVKLHLWAQKMCHLNSGRSRPFHTAGLHLRRMLDCQLHMICLQAKQTHIGLDFTTQTAVLTHFQVILLYKTHTCIVQIIRYVQSVHHSQNRNAVAGVECIAEWKTFNKIKIQRKVCKQFTNICEQKQQLTWWCRRSPVSFSPVYIPASSSCSPKTRVFGLSLPRPEA